MNRRIYRNPLLCFLYKVILISLLLLSGVALLGHLADEGFKKIENCEYEFLTSFYHPIEADVLFVGNSRAGWHIDPAVMDSLLQLSTYNMGRSGGPYEISEVIWRLYQLHNKKKPKLIVCNVDFVWLGNYKHTYLKSTYAPYYNDSCFISIRDQMDLSFAEIYIPGMNYLEQGSLLLTGLRRYAGIPGDFQNDFSITRKGALLIKSDHMNKTRLPQAPRHFQPERKRIEMFNRFLDECRTDTIPVVLVKMPIYPLIYAEFTNMGDFFILIDSLAKAKELPLLDYTDYLIEDTTCFLDPFHLNYKGAQLLSVRLAGDLDSLLTTFKK